MLSKATGIISFPQEYQRELLLNQECSPADLTGGLSCFFLLLVHACAFVDLNMDTWEKFGTYLLVKQPHLHLESENRLASVAPCCAASALKTGLLLDFLRGEK